MSRHPDLTRRAGGSDWRRRRPHGRGRRRLFIAVVLIAVAAGQELLFRGMFCFPELIGFNRLRYQKLDGTHPSLHQALRRGLVYERLLFESEPDGYSEVHELNLYGFRTPDFSIEPPRDRRRILILGDSVVEGQGASDSGTIASSWTRLLAREGIQAEVINLGVVAATLHQVTLLARDAIPLLRPTDVVVVVYANDLPSEPFAAELAGPPMRFPRRSIPWFWPRLPVLFFEAISGEPIYRRWPHRALRFFPGSDNPTNPWAGTSGPPPGLDPAAVPFDEGRPDQPVAARPGDEAAGPALPRLRDRGPAHGASEANLRDLSGWGGQSAGGVRPVLRRHEPEVRPLPEAARHGSCGRG
ncbi:MAG: SGNH/GDSL hydrolase family protein [Isosphaeraceae bacterium]